MDGKKTVRVEVTIYVEVDENLRIDPDEVYTDLKTAKVKMGNKSIGKIYDWTTEKVVVQDD